MKYFIGVLGFAVCVAMVYSETCTVDTDCTTTQCASGAHVLCEHPASGGIVEDGGLCTCAADVCYTREDCLSPNYPQLDCTDDRRHCYDNSCICSRWPVIAGL